MSGWLRFLRQAPIALLSPILVIVELAALWLTDLLWSISGNKTLPGSTQPNRNSASVVIPNWNGKDLLEKYLPSVIAAMSGHPDNELIVVDNGSTDGSAAFLREQFPQVRLVALDQNLGFGGGSNKGFREAKNDIVVLLNSDMRVAPDFLAPLLAGFDAPDVFAVSGSRRSRALTTVLFPQPDSPTSPRTEPGATSKLIPSTARNGPRSVW